MKLTVILTSYSKCRLCLIKQSGQSDFNKNNFKPHFDKRGNQVNFHMDLFVNSKGPNELLDTFKIPTPGSCCMSYPVIICDILVFNDKSNEPHELPESFMILPDPCCIPYRSTCKQIDKTYWCFSVILCFSVFRCAFRYFGAFR